MSEAVLNQVELPEVGLDRGRSSVFVPFARLADVASEPAWVWEGFVAENEVTLLAGKPFAGKSTLVAGLLASMSEGRPFLGLPTLRSTAVVVSEESSSFLLERSERFGLLQTEGAVASRSTGVLGMRWPELIAQATDLAHQAGHRLLVVDTLAGLSRLGREDENDAGAVAERLLPLQQAAGTGLAVLALHHTTKNGGSVRGSSAFSGIADIVVRLSSNRSTGVVTLLSESRSDATPVRLQAKLVKATEGWFYTGVTSTPAAGTERSGRRTNIDGRLFDALAQAGPRGLTYKDLANQHSITESTAKRRLPVLHREEKVDRAGVGTKGQPYRWFLMPS